MTKKNNDNLDGSKPHDDKVLSRRDFVKTGAAAGLGATALLEAGNTHAQASPSNANIDWDYEVDVVIAGGGCAGLTAAIRARDLGASVMVVDQNYDLGGRMLHSGSFTSLGGGDPVQLRDIKGESDSEGWLLRLIRIRDYLPVTLWGEQLPEAKNLKTLLIFFLRISLTGLLLIQRLRVPIDITTESWCVPGLRTVLRHGNFLLITMSGLLVLVVHMAEEAYHVHVVPVASSCLVKKLTSRRER